MAKHRRQSKTAVANRIEKETSTVPESQSNDYGPTEAPAEDYTAQQSLPFEEVQRRAYELYEQKGGNDLDNWLEAERLLKEKR